MSDPEATTRTLYAFEYCSCIYESSFSVVSLHSTKLKAYKAMMKHKNLHWYDARNFLLRWGRETLGWRDGQHYLSDVAYRVRAIELED